MKHTPNECYIDIWREADFRGETRRLHGPASHPHLHFRVGDDWADDIGSLRLGPHAFVLAFRGENYADEMLTLGPNDQVADLRALQFEDEIESLRLINSLKIFDHLHETADDPAHTPGAGLAQSHGEHTLGQGKARGRGRNKRR